MAFPEEWRRYSRQCRQETPRFGHLAPRLPGRPRHQAEDDASGNENKPDDRNEIQVFVERQCPYDRDAKEAAEFYYRNLRY